MQQCGPGTWSRRARGVLRRRQSAVELRQPRPFRRDGETARRAPYAPYGGRDCVGGSTLLRVSVLVRGERHIPPSAIYEARPQTLSAPAARMPVVIRCIGRGGFHNPLNTGVTLGRSMGPPLVAAAGWTGLRRLISMLFSGRPPLRPPPFLQLSRGREAERRGDRTTGCRRDCSLPPRVAGVLVEAGSNGTARCGLAYVYSGPGNTWLAPRRSADHDAARGPTVRPPPGSPAVGPTDQHSLVLTLRRQWPASASFGRDTSAQ